MTSDRTNCRGTLHRFLDATLLAALVGLFLPWEAARSDEFQLKSGGQVVGNLVKRGPDGQYMIETSEGIQLVLSRKQVKRVVTQSEEEVEYARRSKSMPDTAEAHREMAAWCREVGLKKLVDHHLERLLVHDPDDEQARVRLGYQKHKGRWLTRDEIMAQRGLHFFAGSYRTAQDIALRKREKARVEAETQWFRQIRTWVGWLDDRRAAEAEREIASITDPHAAPALVKLLERIEDPEIRDFLTSTLAPLNHTAAVHALVDFSLDDPASEVRLQCLEYLLQFHQPVSLRPYVKTLKHADNELVNRAAIALRLINDQEALSPLIDALVTTHKYANPNAAPGEMNASFSPDGGGGGLSFGNSPKVIEVNHQNVEVRRALVELSGGEDFDYNKNAWRRWFVNQQIHEFVDTRRDE